MMRPATMTTATAQDDIIVSVRDLEVQFQTQDRRATVKAVDGVSFDVRRGETFGIIGESGSGKTTIGRALVFLQKPTAGAILHNGIDPQSLPRGAFQSHRRDYQIIFQDPNAALNPRMTIIASVLEPLELARTASRGERLARARDAMDRVGLPVEIEQRYPHQLSGGQKQRVLIARALTLRPKLIVCDEVVAALDMSIRGDVLNLFAELQRDLGLTYVFITHDLSVVSHISDRIAVMYLGRFVELGPTERVSKHPLHPYTQALLSAEPLPLPSSMRGAKRIILEGEIPSPIDPPSGCRFRTRCRHAQAVCAETTPDWRELDVDHWVACHFAEFPNFSPNEATANEKRITP
jgi:oligopeptide/dipeptide ABC transporter ATP-binding protein